MTKASEYFKTSDELFLTLMGVENSKIVSLIKKKYGNNYDGLKVIKGNKTYIYNVVEEIIKTDLEYINKLMKNEKKLDNFDENFINRFKYVYDLDDDTFFELVEKLPNKSRVSLLYTFGIKRSRMKITEIATFLHCEEKEVLFVLKEGISSLKRKLNGNDIKNNKDIVKVPISLPIYLNSRGYSIDDFHKASKYYDEETITCLKKTYGNRYTSTYTYYVSISDYEKKIILKALESIEENLRKSHEQGEINTNFNRKNLLKYYEKLGFSREQVILVYNDLTEEQKGKIHLLYDEDFYEKDVKISNNLLLEIYDLTKSKKSGILLSLLKTKLSLINENMVDDIISYYEKMGYDRSTILSAIDNIDQSKQDILHLKYDEDFNIKRNVIISDNNRKKIDFIIKEEIANVINQQIKVKSIQVSEKKTSRLSTNNLYAFYKFKNYDEDDINYAISSLNEDDKTLIFSYFDEKTLILIDSSYRDNAKLISKINSILHVKIPKRMIKKRIEQNKSIDNIVMSNLLRNSAESYHKKIKDNNNIEKKLSNQHSKISNLYEYYKKYNYKPDEVDLAIKSLSEEHKLLLFTYYDEETLKLIDSSYYKNSKIKARLYSLKYLTIQAKMIENRIEKGIQLNDLILSNSIKKMIKSDYNKNKSIEFNEYLNSIKELNIINEELINKLEISGRNSFYLRLVFIWNKDNSFDIEEIAEILNIDISKFYLELNHIIKTVVDIVNERLEYKKTLN